jgi:hypothetical protein
VITAPLLLVIYKNRLNLSWSGIRTVEYTDESYILSFEAELAARYPYNFNTSIFTYCQFDQVIDGTCTTALAYWRHQLPFYFPNNTVEYPLLPLNTSIPLSYFDEPHSLEYRRNRLPSVPFHTSVYSSTCPRLMTILPSLNAGLGHRSWNSVSSQLVAFRLNLTFVYYPLHRNQGEEYREAEPLLG